MKQKRNLWPLGIILAFALFIPATLALVVVACLNRNELVTQDYYEQEIRYQEHMERAGRARLLPASVVFDASRQSIQIALPSEHVQQGLTGSIQLYRPSNAALDRELPLAADARGGQIIDARSLHPGLWKIRVSWMANGQSYVIEQKMILGGASSVRNRSETRRIVRSLPWHEPFMLNV